MAMPPLITVAMARKPEDIRLLLQQKASVDVQSSDGRTALSVLAGYATDFLGDLSPPQVLPWEGLCESAGNALDELPWPWLPLFDLPLPFHLPDPWRKDTVDSMLVLLAYGADANAVQGALKKRNQNLWLDEYGGGIVVAGIFRASKKPGQPVTGIVGSAGHGLLHICSFFSKAVEKWWIAEELKWEEVPFLLYELSVRVRV